MYGAFFVVVERVIRIMTKVNAVAFYIAGGLRSLALIG